MTFLSLWVALILVSGRPVRPVVPPSPPAGTPTPVPWAFPDTLREILVLWRSDVPEAERLQVLQPWGHVVRQGRFAPVTVIRVAPSTPVESVLARLRQDPRVRAADRNYRRWLAWTPNDPLFPEQWGLQPRVLNMPEAWDQAPTAGAGVKVGILDSGVAFEDYEIPEYERDEVASSDGWYHQAPDLAETPFAGGYDAVHNDFHPNDQHGHGTHVAGIIAQSTDNAYGTAGVAFGATLVPVQVASAQGVVADDWVVEGIAYALQQGVQVINMSFGSPDSSTVVHAALQQADSAGVLLVAASGNSGDSSVWYPAAFPEVLAVGAVNQSLQRAPYSCYGQALDLVAPGGYPTDTVPGILQQTYAPVGDSVVHVDTFAFVYKVGTSMAAPHVAGVAALLLSVGATPQEAKAALLNSARDLGPPGWDPEYGHGLVDAAAALAYVLGDSGTGPTLDTLRNPYGDVFLYSDDPQYQVLYEATRLRPEAPCSLLTLRFLFYNYDSLTAHTKPCSVFVWADEGGQPGAPLLAWVDSITLGPDSLGYLEVPVDSLALETPFWVGHLEITPGPPTSVLDEGAQGTNMYRFPNEPQWYLDPDYDYIQEAVVRYYTLNDSVPPDFEVSLLPNPYLVRNLDIWVVASEPLAGGDLPPESAAVITPDSLVYPLVFRDVDRQTYKADFVVVDTGVLTLWVKGRDPAGNWGEITLTFRTAWVGPEGARLVSPDRRLEVDIPPGGTAPRLALCVERGNATYDLKGRVPGPVRVRYQTPVPVVPQVPDSSRIPFTYQGGAVVFSLPRLMTVTFRPLLHPWVWAARNPARGGDPLRVWGLSPRTRAVEIFRADGRRWGEVPLIRVQPTQGQAVLPRDLPAGVYFLRAAPDGRNITKIVVLP